MTPTQPTWGDDWTVGLHVYVDRAGRALLGPGRVELLEGIDRSHSISGAARAMGMSYRRAWLLVQSMNEAAGQPLVEAATGGQGGGGARLTPLGRWAAGAYRDLQGRLESRAGSLPPTGPDAGVVHVAAAASLEEVFSQLQADYALREPAVRVRVVFGASDELADHLLAGAPADLFLTADPHALDRLEAAHLLAPGGRLSLASNTLAAVGPAGREVAVHRPADLLAPGAGPIMLAHPSTPLGGYTRAYLEGIGLYQALLQRAVLADNAGGVAAAVRAGRAEVGIVYGSDAARADGCRLLFRAGRLPRPIRYTAALVGRWPATASAQALLAFLTSGAAAVRFRACGFLPAPRRGR